MLSMLVRLAAWGKSAIPVERMGLWAKGEAHSSGPVGWEREIVRQLLSLKLRGINWKRAGSLESVWEISGRAVLDDPAPKWRRAYASMDALCCFEILPLRINAFQILYISSDFFCIWLVCIGKKNSVRPVVPQAPSRFSQYKEQILPVQWMETAQLQDPGTLLAESSLKREDSFFIFFSSLYGAFISLNI